MTTTVKYFAADGAEIPHPYSMKRARFAELFGECKALRYDSFSFFVGKHPVTGLDVPAVRRIYYKVNGSKHKCDGRCLHAKGRNCECACGGANHGAGD